MARPSPAAGRSVYLFVVVDTAVSHLTEVCAFGEPPRGKLQRVHSSSWFLGLSSAMPTPLQSVPELLETSY